MGDFSDDYGGYDVLGLYEQRDEERRAQRAKLLTPARKTILKRKELQDTVAKIWSDAIESTYKDLMDAAVLAEREACAKVCEQSEIPIPIDVWHGSTKKEMTAYTALALAAAIRARGTT